MPALPPGAARAGLGVWGAGPVFPSRRVPRVGSSAELVLADGVDLDGAVAEFLGQVGAGVELGGGDGGFEAVGLDDEKAPMGLACCG